MQVYEDKNDIKIVQHVASASTLISSVAGAIREYVTSRFPKNYFRHIYMDTRETPTEYYQLKKYNDKLSKIPYPSMTIGTEISLDDPIGGMSKRFELSSTNLFLQKDLRRSYIKLLADPSLKFNIYFSADYITTNFLFHISTNKYIQNVDLAYYLKARFQNEFFLFLNNQMLNAELPKTFVRALADYKGLDISQDEDLLKLEEYLAAASTQDTMIQRKINASTGKDCFFFGHKENLLTYFADLDAPPSISRNQMSEDIYTVNFRIQVSTWLPNSYILSVDKSVFKDFSKDTIDSIKGGSDFDEMSEGFYSNSASINKEFILDRRLQIYYENSSGEKCIGHEVLNRIVTFKLDDEDKVVNLMPLLKEDAKKVHAFMKDKSMQIDDVFRIRVLNKNKSNEEFESNIDYETLSVKIDSDETEDVMVSLYIDRTAMAAILQAIKKDTFFFNNMALATIRITTGGMDLKVRVYSFGSKGNQSTSDILKSVRVYTPYGIGYIGLVEPGSKNASEYKVCVGFDESNNPIIKSFELAN